MAKLMDFLWKKTVQKIQTDNIPFTEKVNLLLKGRNLINHSRRLLTDDVEWFMGIVDFQEDFKKLVRSKYSENVVLYTYFNRAFDDIKKDIIYLRRIKNLKFNEKNIKKFFNSLIIDLNLSNFEKYIALLVYRKTHYFRLKDRFIDGIKEKYNINPLSKDTFSIYIPSIQVTVNFVYIEVEKDSWRADISY